MSDESSILIVHPSLAPYRVGFFNDVTEQIKTIHVFFYLERMYEHPHAIGDFSVNYEYSIGTKHEFKKWSPIHIAIRIFIPLLKTLRNKQPSVIISNEYGPISIFLALYCRLLGLTHIAWTDDSYENAKYAGLFRRCRRALVLHLSSALVVCNPQVKEYYQKRLSYRVESVELLQKEDGFREKLLGAIPTAGRLVLEYRLEGKKIILFVGRLAHVKNLDALIETLAICSDPSALLVLVGSGDKENELRRRAESLGIKEKVIFTGYQKGNDLLAWYTLGGLFVLPSVYEPFGAVVNEALIGGMPVLCSNRAGAGCLISCGENGDLFNPDDKDEFKRKLSVWIKKVEPQCSAVNLRKSKMMARYQDIIDRFVSVATMRSRPNENSSGT